MYFQCQTSGGSFSFSWKFSQIFSDSIFFQLPGALQLWHLASSGGFFAPSSFAGSSCSGASLAALGWASPVEPLLDGALLLTMRGGGGAGARSERLQFGGGP